jgi:hypothetical protein
MSQTVLYRQYWMATLRDRHMCYSCGNLAINALEFMDENGICDSVTWFCKKHNLLIGEKDIVGSS